MKSKFLILISWILVIIWMSMIFVFSNMNSKDSSNTSTSLIKSVVKTGSKIGNKIGINDKEITEKKLNKISKKANKPIRKLAHFSEYLLLGFLVFNALYVSGFEKKIIISAILICMFYAISDEYHQLFIDGRSGEILDVLIDTSGSIVGILISILITSRI